VRRPKTAWLWRYGATAALARPCPVSQPPRSDPRAWAQRCAPSRRWQGRWSRAPRRRCSRPSLLAARQRRPRRLQPGPCGRGPSGPCADTPATSPLQPSSPHDGRIRPHSLPDTPRRLLAHLLYRPGLMGHAVDLLAGVRGGPSARDALPPSPGKADARDEMNARPACLCVVPPTGWGSASGQGNSQAPRTSLLPAMCAPRPSTAIGASTSARPGQRRRVQGHERLLHDGLVRVRAQHVVLGCSTTPRAWHPGADARRGPTPH
jgi:hypothetical protein